MYLVVYLRPCFLKKACIAIYFSLRTAFAASRRSQTVVFSFSLVSMNLLSSILIPWLIHSSFSRTLFNLHVFGFLPNFFLWLSSSFKALWSENMQGTIPILWYLLRPDLLPSVWSILEKVPCALEKNVYSVDLDVKFCRYLWNPSGPVSVSYTHLRAHETRV